MTGTPAASDKRPSLAAPKNTLDELIGPSTARRDPPPGQATADPAPAAPPARPAPRATTAAAPPGQRRPPRGNARGRMGVSAEQRTGLPPRLAEEVPTKPLQVRLPVAEHWQLKQAAAWNGTDMSEIVTTMLGVYLHDPDLLDRLATAAAAQGVTLGELLHEALLAVET